MTPSHDPLGTIEVVRRDDTQRPVRPSPERFNRAVVAGRRRRRLKLAALTTASSAVLFVGGFAALARDSAPNRLRVADSTIETIRTEQSDSPNLTTTPTTSTPSTPPTSAAQSLAVPDDLFVIVSGSKPEIIDVRNATGVVASVDLGCDASLVCDVQAARVMDDTIWVAISETDDAAAPVRTRVVSVSRTSWQTEEHLRLDGPATVRSAGRGANGLLYAYIVDNLGAGRSLVTVADGQATPLRTKASGFRLSDDGRFLAVSFSDPPAGEGARLEISDLVNRSTASFDLPGINAGPGEWSPDGRYLIINEQWEDGTAWVIDPWSGSAEPIFGGPGGDTPAAGDTDSMLDGACFVSDVVIAHRTWNVPYGEGSAQTGAVRLTSLETGETTGELGTDLFGDAFHCHADGSVSVVRRPLVDVQLSPGVSQIQPDNEAASELLRITPDETTSILTDDDLRIVS